jgi:hypothetical protein
MSEQDEAPSEQGHVATRADRRLHPGLDAATQLATIVAGSVGFLYLLGGMLLYIRFSNADVPAGRAVSLVDGARLIQTGVQGILVPVAFMLLVAAGLLAIGRAGIARRPMTPRGSARGCGSASLTPSSPGSWFSPAVSYLRRRLRS